jgi:hypothetical protein
MTAESGVRLLTELGVVIREGAYTPVGVTHSFNTLGAMSQTSSIINLGIFFVIAAKTRSPLRLGGGCHSIEEVAVVGKDIGKHDVTRTG